ncbi:MAG: hypothetical protein KC731_27895, partial [Myxococcales bacterium]|nr:hypothetical protein [Myxococcales bacterium]
MGLTFDEEEAARVSRVVRRLSPSGLEFAADLERERGMLVRGAFAAHAAVGALAAAWSFLSPERVSAQPLVLTATASLVVLTLVAWLGPCYRHTRGWGIAEVPYTESQVVWGFFNPLVVWIRPYRALVQLHRASDPDLLPLA